MDQPPKLHMMDSELRTACREDHIRDTEYDQQGPWKSRELEIHKQDREKNVLKRQAHLASVRYDRLTKIFRGTDF